MIGLRGQGCLLSPIGVRGPNVMQMPETRGVVDTYLGYER